MTFFITTSTFATNEEKQRAYEGHQSRNTTVFGSEDEFFQDLIDNDTDKMIERHEAVLSQQLDYSFFLDFDFPVMKKWETADAIELKKVAIATSLEICDFLYEKFNWYKVKKNNERKTLTKETFKKRFVETMRVAVSTETSTCRIHMYFKNIRIFTNQSKSLRKALTEWKRTNTNETHVDNLIYKEGFNLRCILSNKNNKTSYYVPKVLTKTQDNIKITSEDEELTLENLHHYFINPPCKNTHMTFTELRKDEEEEQLSFNHDFSAKIENPEESPYIMSLKLVHVLEAAFGSKYIIRNQMFNHLKITTPNITLNSDLKDIIIDGGKEQIEFVFDYDVRCCFFCGKNVHKHHFILSFGNLGILIYKSQGNSCQRKKKGQLVDAEAEAEVKLNSSDGLLKVFQYPKLTILQILNFFIAKKEVKITDDSDILLYLKNRGWEKNRPVQAFFQKVAHEMSYPHLLSSHKAFLLESPPKKVENHLNELSSYNLDVAHIEPHMIRVKNGILNLENQEVIPISESKHLVVVNPPIPTAFKKLKDFTENEASIRREYFKILASSQPEYFPDGTKNSNREKLDEIRGTILIRKPKHIITMYQGPSRCGKSTLLKLDSQLLTFSNYAKASKDVISKDIGSGPTPEIAQIANKYLFHIVEIDDKISMSAIKTLTEDRIPCRNLYENKSSQSSFATIVCDTNSDLNGDIDPASANRVCVINYETSHDLNHTNAQYNNIPDPDLPLKVSAGIYNQAVLLHLVELAKRHIPSIMITPTPERFPQTQFIQLLGKIFISCWNFKKILENNPTYIKKESQEKYQILQCRIAGATIDHFAMNNVELECLFESALTCFSSEHLKSFFKKFLTKTTRAFISFNDLTQDGQELILKHQKTEHGIGIDPEMCLKLDEYMKRNEKKVVKSSIF